MAVNGADHQLTGRVVAVNEKGLKFEGAGAWLNVSKYALGVLLPEKGADVTVTLDKAGFIRSVEMADGASLVAPTPPFQGGNIARTATDVTAPERTSGQQKDRTITRLACLKAAAEFGAARPNLKSGDILTIAASWERWVTRDTEHSADLTDAF